MIFSGAGGLNVPPPFYSYVMVVKFISKSDISVNVRTRSGENVHVSFCPLTGGGSAFYTEDEELQSGLISHHMYGCLFEIDESHNTEPEPETEPEDTKKELPVIQVGSLAEAAEYLCDRFSFSRTKLKNKKSILSAAAASGIAFEGI